MNADTDKELYTDKQKRQLENAVRQRKSRCIRRTDVQLKADKATVQSQIKTECT
jgi:hypothetical protein